MGIRVNNNGGEGRVQWRGGIQPLATPAAPVVLRASYLAPRSVGRRGCRKAVSYVHGGDGRAAGGGDGSVQGKGRAKEKRRLNEDDTIYQHTGTTR